MNRLLSSLAVVSLLFGIADPASPGELKPQPNGSSNSSSNTAGGQKKNGAFILFDHNYEVLGAGRKPKEIVVVGSKAKKRQGGKTTSTDDWSDPQ